MLGLLREVKDYATKKLRDSAILHQQVPGELV